MISVFIHFAGFLIGNFMCLKPFCHSPLGDNAGAKRWNRDMLVCGMCVCVWRGEAASKLWLEPTKPRSYWLAQWRHWAAFHHTLMRSPDLHSSARSPEPTVIALSLMASVTHALQPPVMTITIMSPSSAGGLPIIRHFGRWGVSQPMPEIKRFANTMFWLWYPLALKPAS